jgi:hypothetical protein
LIPKLFKLADQDSQKNILADHKISKKTILGTIK